MSSHLKLSFWFSRRSSLDIPLCWEDWQQQQILYVQESLSRSDYRRRRIFTPKKSGVCVCRACSVYDQRFVDSFFFSVGRKLCKLSAVDFGKRAKHPCEKSVALPDKMGKTFLTGLGNWYQIDVRSDTQVFRLVDPISSLFFSFEIVIEGGCGISNGTLGMKQKQGAPILLICSNLILTQLPINLFRIFESGGIESLSSVTISVWNQNWAKRFYRRKFAG